MATMQDGYVALPLHADEREELNWIELKKVGKAFRMAARGRVGRKQARPGKAHGWTGWIRFPVPVAARAVRFHSAFTQVLT